jgi:hypothetical protein
MAEGLDENPIEFLVDIGLQLKDHRSFYTSLNYTRWGPDWDTTTNNWQLSDECIRIVKEYQNTFSDIW